MKEVSKIDPTEFGLEKKNVEGIEGAFAPKVIEREALADIYELVIAKEMTPELCKEAGDLRKKLVKVRTGIRDIHKSQKSFFLAAGKFVDAWKNKETLPITQMEDVLAGIEKHFEIIEAKRIEDLNTERRDKISKYLDPDADVTAYGTMADDVWESFYEYKRTKYDEAQKAIRAEEEKQEARRLAKEEDTRRVAAENKKLKEESVKRDKADRARADEWVKEQRAAKAKQAKVDRAREVELEKTRVAQAKLDQEKEAELKRVQEKARLAQNEIDDRNERERLAALKVEQNKQAELSKGDAAKVEDLISSLKALAIQFTFRSVKNKKMYAHVTAQIKSIISDIKYGK